MSEVKFISYDGAFPNLCAGTLVLEIDGNRVCLDHCLSSGGQAWIDRNGDDHTCSGEWTVNLPSEYEHLEKQITDIVNENIPFGCCGGCI